MPIGTHLKNKLLALAFGAVAYTSPTALKILLLTAAPNNNSDSSTVTQANYTGYAALSITNNTTNFVKNTDGIYENGLVFAFGDCTAGSSVVTHVMVVDDATPGNNMGWCALDAAKTITAGDPVSFPAGSLKFKLQDPA